MNRGGCGGHRRSARYLNDDGDARNNRRYGGLRPARLISSEMPMK